MLKQELKPGAEITVSSFFINNINYFRTSLSKKYDEFETSYNELMDELVEKIKDLEIYDLPPVEIPQFLFLTEWSNGTKSSQDVLQVLDALNVEDVAKLRVARRLQNYMMVNDELAEHIKPYLARLAEDAVPLYCQYLNIMKIFFKKASECDEQQYKVTWIEVETKLLEGNTIDSHKFIGDFTLTQTIRQLQECVVPNNMSKYFVGQNVLCFDEELEKGTVTRTHWLFAPSNYARLIQNVLEVKTEVELNVAGPKIKALIAEYIK